jgi:hypothetical protein
MTVCGPSLRVVWKKAGHVYFMQDGARASLNDMEKRKFLILLGLDLRPVGLLACSQSLYRLRYPGSHKPLGLAIISR